LDKKAGKTRKEKIIPLEENEEQFAKRYFSDKIKFFKKLKKRVEAKLKKLPEDDKSPAEERGLYALSQGLFAELVEIYELLDVTTVALFAYDKDYLEIGKQLKALGRTVKKPEYKHIQKLLETLAEMERNARSRPLDKMMYGL
jgi:hypothetical protein